jgi:hypothetical protein
VPAVHAVVGFSVLALTLGAALLGAWRWSRAETSDGFWKLLRASQAALLVQVTLGVVLLVLGHHPAKLHLLYGLVPVVVWFAAEQLRVGAAQAVLDARDLESAEAVGKLPEAEQRSIVLTIVRREMGVMILAGLVVLVLAVRAASVAGGL